MKKYNVWAIVELIDEAVDENGKDISARKLGIFKNENDAVDFLESIWIDDILESNNGHYPYESEIKDKGRRVK